MLATVAVSHVEVREEHAATSPTGRDGLVVLAHFNRGGESHGIALDASPSGRKLADRLARAIEAGVVFTNPHLKERADGSLYVGYGTAVIGRRLNADLRRLGF